MKLQYLGDVRDAFKWDLLHWLCSTGGKPLSLLFVPLLTPDDTHPVDGLIPDSRFKARPPVQRFVRSLRGTARGLRAITDLGSLDSARPFSVSIHGPDRHVPTGRRRPRYWDDLSLSADSVVFLDPDNGLETKTRRGVKWVRHDEIRMLLDNLPERSSIVLYQHRPRQKWDDVFTTLAQHLHYAPHVSATYNSGLAFIIIAPSYTAGARLSAAAKGYADQHRSVAHKLLINKDILVGATDAIRQTGADLS